MKQKNLILVAVAVVCGLVAAVLTSQMGAKGKAKVEETMIVVAAKEIPIGSRLPKDPKELEKWVKLKPVPKETVQQQYVQTLEEMAEKYVMNRTYRENEPLNPMDVSGTGMMAPPEGFGMMSLPIQPDAAVSGFIRPGTHVDVWASLQKRKSAQYVAFPMFLDMLVLAVNQDASGGGTAGGQAYQGVSMVSMAVKPEHTELYQLAIARGAQMRLVMRHPEEGKGSIYDKKPDPKAIRDILTDKDEEVEPVAKKDPPKKETVKLKVAGKDLPAQTEITADLIAGAFKDVEVAADQVPENAIRNLSEHIGRYLQKDLTENQFVPRGFLGAKQAEVPPAPRVAVEPEPMKPADPVKPRPGPGDVAGEKAPPPDLPKPVPSKPVAKPEYVDVTVTTVSGIRTLRYLKLPNGELRKLGDVRPGAEPATKDEEPPKAVEKGNAL